MTNRIALIALFAALALPGAAAPSARTHAYRAVAIERLTSGAPGAHPNLGLLAHLDDGAGGRPLDTGELEFTLSRQQLDEESVQGLVNAPGGTLFGWVTAPGGSAVQMPLRKTGMTAEGVVTAKYDIPPEYAPVVGPTGDVSIRIDPDALVVRMNLQEIDGRWWRENRTAVDLDLIGIYFLGEYRAGGVARHFAVNPAAPADLTLALTAWPCADVECTRLGSPVTDTVGFALPKRVSVTAPRRAMYGRNVTFSGTAPPGDSIHVSWLRPPGGEPACTSDTARPCSPTVAAAYDPIGRLTRAGADGRWTLAVALRSLFSGPQGRPHAASGRYAAVAFTGSKPWADPSFNGGTFSIFVPASVETRVALSKPTVAVRREGSKLRVTVAVLGGDPRVRVVLTIGVRRVASARLNGAGRLTALVPAPVRNTTLTAVASVWGAESSRASLKATP